MRPCMMRKCGLLTLSCTEQKRSATRLFCTLMPFIRYLFLPPITTCRRGIQCVLRGLMAKVEAIWMDNGVWMLHCDDCDELSPKHKLISINKNGNQTSYLTMAGSHSGNWVDIVYGWRCPFIPHQRHRAPQRTSMFRSLVQYHPVHDKSFNNNMKHNIFMKITRHLHYNSP